MPILSDEPAQMTRLTIGQVARQVGLSAKTIRYYEENGILPPPTRAENGYRAYSRADLNRLLLLGRLRALGVPPSLMRDLLASATRAGCAEVQGEVRAVLTDHLARLDREIAELTRLRATLRTATRALAACPGEEKVPFALCADVSCIAPLTTDCLHADAAGGRARPGTRDTYDGPEQLEQEKCHHGNERCCAMGCA